MSAHILDFDFQLILRSTGRALEGHVFEEVCGAVVVGCFVPRSGIDPYPDRGGVGARHCFGCDAQTGRGEARNFSRGRSEEVGREGQVGGGGGDIATMLTTIMMKMRR